MVRRPARWRVASMNTGIGASASTARTATTIPTPAAKASNGVRTDGQHRARKAATARAGTQPAARMPAYTGAKPARSWHVIHRRSTRVTSTPNATNAWMFHCVCTIEPQTVASNQASNNGTRRVVQRRRRASLTGRSLIIARLCFTSPLFLPVPLLRPCRSTLPTTV